MSKFKKVTLFVPKVLYSTHKTPKKFIVAYKNKIKILYSKQQRRFSVPNKLILKNYVYKEIKYVNVKKVPFLTRIKNVFNVLISYKLYQLYMPVKTLYKISPLKTVYKKKKKLKFKKTFSINIKQSFSKQKILRKEHL
jgi:hypothetical protein